MVICLEQGADLHTAQLMPLPLTVSCFSKIQIGCSFLVPAHPGSTGQRAVKRVCVSSISVVKLCVYRTRWSRAIWATVTSTGPSSFCWRMCVTLCRSSGAWCWSWRCVVWFAWVTSARSASCRPAATEFHRPGAGSVLTMWYDTVLLAMFIVKENFHHSGFGRGCILAPVLFCVSRWMHNSAHLFQPHRPDAGASLMIWYDMIQSY